MTTPTDSTSLPPLLLARAQEAQVATDEANARKAATDADTSALTLAQAKYKSLVPDLTGTSVNAVNDKSTGVAFSGLVTYSALNHAAEILACRISKALKGSAEAGPATILVTSQSDLLTNDLLWSTVESGLSQLIAFADRVLETGSPAAAEGGKPAEGDEADTQSSFLVTGPELDKLLESFTASFAGGLPAAGAAGAVGAAAFGPIGLGAAAVAAVPSIISLFSSTTTVKDHTEDITDLATTTSVMAAVAETLTGYTVVHEDFRLAPSTSAIRDTYQHLAARRTALLFRQEQVQVVKNEADLDLARAQQKQDAAKKAQPKPDPATTGQHDAGQTAQPPEATDGTAQPPEPGDPIAGQIAAATAASANAAAQLSLISGAITCIDAFSTAVNATAAGTRSPLAIATLHELLHQEGDDAIRYVLSVKGLGGQSEEYTKDRHVGFDTYTTLADASVSFMLYDTATRKIVTSEVANGVSSVHGRLGHPPTGLLGPNSASAIDDQTADFPPPEGGQDEQATPHQHWWRRLF